MLTLPTIDPNTGYLPPGTYQMQWNEVVQYFGNHCHRIRLIGGLAAACRNPSSAGCKCLILDGNFVITKHRPADYDGVWESDGVDYRLLNPVLIDFSELRTAMKVKNLGDLFPVNLDEALGQHFVYFFLIDRNGVEKDLVRIKLDSFYDHKRETVSNHA